MISVLLDEGLLMPSVLALVLTSASLIRKMLLLNDDEKGVIAFSPIRERSTIRPKLLYHIGLGVKGVFGNPPSCMQNLTGRYYIYIATKDGRCV